MSKKRQWYHFEKDILIKRRKLQRYIMANYRLLEDVNEHPRDKNIFFDDPPHWYYINGDRRGYISTTTYIGKYIFDDHFDQAQALEWSLRKEIYQHYVRDAVDCYCQKHHGEFMKSFMRSKLKNLDKFEKNVIREKIESMFGLHKAPELSQETLAKLSSFARITLTDLYSNLIATCLQQEECRRDAKDRIADYWATSNRKSQEDGTDMHENVENYNDGKSHYRDGKEWEFFEHFERDFADMIKLRFRTEMEIYDVEHKFTGSIDMVYRAVNGGENDFVLVDWKRCKEIKTRPDQCFGKYGCVEGISDHLPDINYWHYAFQLNMYAAVLERNYGMRILDMYIVCMHPNQQDYQCYKIERMSREVEAIFKMRREQLEKDSEKPYPVESWRVFEQDEEFTPIEIQPTDKSCIGCTQKLWSENEQLWPRGQFERKTKAMINDTCGHYICEECFTYRFKKLQLKLVCTDCVVIEKQKAKQRSTGSEIATFKTKIMKGK